MFKDSGIIDTCVTATPQLIEKIHETEALRRARIDDEVDADDKNWIRLTGDGDHDSSITNAFEQFCKKFPATWAVLLFLIGLSWWPVIGNSIVALISFIRS